MKGYPKELHLLLNDEPQRKQSTRAGIYILQKGTINDYPHWVNENKISALWFKDQKWLIGNVDLLGGSIASIKSSIPANVNPSEVTTV